MGRIQLSPSLRSDSASLDLQDCADVFVHLLTFGQTLSEEIESAAERLGQEVKRLTQGKAWLVLRGRTAPTELPAALKGCATFPVQFDQRIYGTLSVLSEGIAPTRPALPLPLAHALAWTCGLLLHQLELTMLIEGQARRLADQIPSQLTRREREVLKLVCQGYTLQEIADSLQVADATVETYRKRLCRKLGVRSQRDVPLAAYHASLFSIFD